MGIGLYKVATEPLGSKRRSGGCAGGLPSTADDAVPEAIDICDRLSITGRSDSRFVR